MNDKITVIHHSADFDGLFCREIARHFLPSAELIGWDYGNPKLPFPQGFVYVLDLSPECFDTSYTDECNSRLYWIDHHKSAIDMFYSSIPGYRIDGVAACRLAWQWFIMVDGNTNCGDVGNSIRAAGVLPMIQDFKQRIVNEPVAVRLAGEYDIWDKRDPDAELFQHGLRSEELTPHTWKAMLDSEGFSGPVIRLLEQGKILQFSRTKENESIIRKAGFTLQWEGLTFLACNAAIGNSHLFTAGLRPEHDACYYFAYRDGQWAVSLYHAPGKEHHDLSVIAKKYGGGGHRGACGFRAKTLPFLAA